MKTKKNRWLFLLMCLVTVAANQEPKQVCSSDGGKALYTKFLRIGDAIGDFLPGIGFVSSGLWLLNDLESDGDVEKTIQCHLKNHNNVKLWDDFHSLKESMVKAVKENDRQSLQKIRGDLESYTQMSELVVSTIKLKASVWPVLFFFALAHLELYQHLMPNPKDEKRYNEYADKHDEFVEFYAKLILRYWKPFREELITDKYLGYQQSHICTTTTHGGNLQYQCYSPEGMNGEGKKDWKEYNLQVSPAEKLLDKWDKYPIKDANKKKIRKLLDSCIVRKDSKVMFRKLENKTDWLSCSGSEEKESYWLFWSKPKKCEWSGCPELNNPTFKPGSHEGLSCRGQTFWIYSDSETITHGSNVNIKYSVKYGKGYWLSWNDKETCITQNCPGIEFTGIRGCDKENWIIKKRGKSVAYIAADQLDAIYDGNVIELNYKSYLSVDFVILKDGAETNNQEEVARVHHFVDDDDDTEGIRQDQDGTCQVGWSYYYQTASCFKIITDKLSWFDAKARCESLATGSNLASVTNAQENEHIKELLSSANEKVGYWMGLNDRRQEGTFEWLDKTPLTFVGSSNFPSPATYTDEDCVAWWPNQWHWNDANCGRHKLSSVCKMPATSSTMTSTTTYRPHRACSPSKPAMWPPYCYCSDYVTFPISTSPFSMRHPCERFSIPSFPSWGNLYG